MISSYQLFRPLLFITPIRVRAEYRNLRTVVLDSFNISAFSWNYRRSAIKIDILKFLLCEFFNIYSFCLYSFHSGSYFISLTPDSLSVVDDMFSFLPLWIVQSKF